MSLRTDCGGLAVRAEIKVSTQVSTWNTRLTQLLRGEAEITICTFSLPPTMDYLHKLFDKRSRGVTIIANSKFAREAKILKRQYPALKIYLPSYVHAKMVLASPDKVWLSSENLVQSRNFENTVGIHNRAVYDFYMNELHGNGLFTKEMEG